MSERIARSIAGWHPDSLCFFLRDYDNSDTYDLQEIYLMIFRRLRASGVDWGFCPPDVFEAAVDRNTSSSGNELPQEENPDQKETEPFIMEIARLKRARQSMPWSGPDPSPADAYRCVYGREPQ